MHDAIEDLEIRIPSEANTTEGSLEGLSDAKHALLDLIEAERRRRGLTQVHLAKLVQMPQTTISAFLKRPKNLQTDRLLEVLNRLGYDIAIRPSRVTLAEGGETYLTEQVPIFERLNLPAAAADRLLKSGMTLVCGPDPGLVRAAQISAMTYSDRDGQARSYLVEEASRFSSHGVRTFAMQPGQSLGSAVEFIWKGGVPKIISTAEPANVEDMQAFSAAAKRCHVMVAFEADSAAHALSKMYGMRKAAGQTDFPEHEDILQALVIRQDLGGTALSVEFVDLKNETGRQMLLERRFRDVPQLTTMHQPSRNMFQ